MSTVTLPEEQGALAHELGMRGTKTITGETKGAAVALWPPGATPSPRWVDGVVKQQIPVIHNEETRIPKECNGFLTPIDFGDISALFRTVDRVIRQARAQGLPVATSAAPLPPVPQAPLDIPNLPDEKPTPQALPAETSNVEEPKTEERACAHCSKPLKESQAKFCSKQCVGASRRKKK